MPRVWNLALGLVLGTAQTRKSIPIVSGLEFGCLPNLGSASIWKQPNSRKTIGIYYCSIERYANTQNLNPMLSIETKLAQHGGDTM